MNSNDKGIDVHKYMKNEKTIAIEKRSFERRNGETLSVCATVFFAAIHSHKNSYGNL